MNFNFLFLNNRAIMQKSIKFWFSKRNHTASFILSHIGKSLCFDFNLKQQRGLRERCRIGKPPAAIFIQGGIYMNQTTQMQPVNRLYKSRIFAMLYSDRKMQSTCRCIMICPFSLIPDFPCMSISPPTVPTCPCGICFISRICIPG